MTDPKTPRGSYWTYDSATGSFSMVSSDVTPETNPGDFTYETHNGYVYAIYTGGAGASSTANSTLPSDYLTGLDRETTDAGGLGARTAEQAEAGHYATVDGQNVYIPTQAEIDAAASGLARDATGFYHMVGGKKVYETGDENGIRYHYDAGAALDPVTGQHPIADRKYDDDRFRDWVTPHGTNSELNTKLHEYQDQLASLRSQYTNARADNWVLRENLLTRIRDMEDAVTAVNLALGNAPSQVIVQGPSQDNQYEQPMQLAMQFAILDDTGTGDGSLSFGPSLNEPPPGAHILVALTVTLGANLRWRPDTLQQPDCVAVQWLPPAGWESLDGLPATAFTDEFVNGGDASGGGSVTIIRDFRAPASGDTSTGLTEYDSFNAVVLPYHIVLDPLDTPTTSHNEGDDGYFGALVDSTTPGGDALTKFMFGLCSVETNCNNDPLYTRSSKFHFGPYQMSTAAWPGWSIQILKGTQADWIRDTQFTHKWMWPKTLENEQAVAFGLCANMYAHFGSWRRVAIAWHKGRGFAKANPNAGLPGYGFEGYSNRVLAKAGLPLD